MENRPDGNLSPTGEPPMKPGKQVPGWFNLWSGLSFVVTFLFLIFAPFIGLPFGRGPIVAPWPEVITAIAMALMMFGPTLYWLGRLAFIVWRRLAKA